MREEIKQYILDLLVDIAQVDTHLVLLAVLIVCTVIVIDAISLFARGKRKETGTDLKSVTVSIEGNKTIPVRNYISHIQGLAGRPDALIIEDGNFIPVERKPLAKKIRDRHVAQVLVYMRLVEEFEGKKPPYGYLILGPTCRRFKIMNSDNRQAWLQKMLDEMRAILEQNAAVRPAPQLQKCRKCPVRNSCSHKIDDTQQIPSQNVPQSRLAKRA